MNTHRLSRRRAIGLGLRALAIGGWVVSGSLPARAQAEKISQADAGYRDHPNGSKACAACSHFQPPNACHLVAGKISPNGWCRYFAAKP